MSKIIDDQSKDALLAEIADNGDTMHLCSAAPADYADTLVKSIGSVALTPGDGNGDFTIGDGVVSGRKLSVAQQSVAGTANGTATHIAIVDSANLRMKALTTAPNYNVTLGGSTTVPAYDACEVQDPT